MTTAAVEKPAETQLVIRRSFEADRRTLWTALTDPAAWIHWMGGGDVTCVDTRADLRVGGAYRIDMRHRKTGERHMVEGEFTEIREPDFVSFTWAWYTTPDRVSHVSYRLSDGERAGQTVLVLTHDRFYDADARDGHARGWSSSLDKLAAWVAS